MKKADAVDKHQINLRQKHNRGGVHTRTVVRNSSAARGKHQTFDVLGGIDMCLDSNITE